MLEGWAERRGCILHAGILSPHGFLAEADGAPVACCWATVMMSIPVVQVDHVYFARRVRVEEMREAWDSLVSAVKAWMRAMNEQGGFDYNIIEIFMNPAMQAEVERHGGLVSQASYKRAHYIL